MTNLEPWWEVANPHEDIRQGDFPEAVFAIDLGTVLSNPDDAPEIYSDPATFYRKTHVTTVLERLMQRTVDTLGGSPSGNRVIRLQTGFGGGKTHLLLSIYHLLHSPDEVAEVEKARSVLDGCEVDEVPESNVAVIVGTDMDVSGGRNVEGLDLLTPWGELAYQLGGKKAYESIRESDQNRISPGKDKIAQILRDAQPCVVLIDELLQYVLRARGLGIEVGESAYVEHVIAFLDELVRAVETVPRAMAIVSLQASERFEMYGDPETAEQLLNQMESKVGRVDTETRPVQKAEVYSIARQRLFEDIGEEEAKTDVADAFYDYYQENSSDFPDYVEDPDYRDRIVEAYPFHPEFVDTLYQQWGSLPDFHRTRGVLRLLAKVVSDQYTEQHHTPLIQPGQLNLADDKVRDEVLRYFDEGWDSVIDSDIAGSQAKSAEIDRQMGGVYHSKRVTQSVAASLLLYSKTGGQQPGASLERLRLGSLHPDMSPTLVADAISKSQQSFFFLHEEDGFFKFTKTANLNQVQSRYETKIDDEDKTDAIFDAFSEVYGESCFKVHLWPSGPGDVPDDPTLRLVILHPDHTLDTGSTETMGMVEEIWKNSTDEFRTCKNSLVFLAADSSAITDLRDAATTKLALQDIRDNPALLDNLEEQQTEELQKRLKRASKAMPTEIRKAYTEAVVPGNGGLRRHTLERSLVSTDDGIDVLLERKMEEKDLLLSKLDPHLIASDRWGLWPAEETGDGEERTAPHITTQALWEHFSQLPQLPMLKSLKVLKRCIAQGVDEEGVFGYGRLTEEGYEDIRFQEAFNPGDVEISDEAVIIREAKVRPLIEWTEESDEEEEGETGQETPETQPQIETEPTPSPATGPRHSVETVTIKATPEWETQWDQTYEALIDPLARLGADIEIDVKVEATSEDGLDKTEIERQIEENLTQRGIDHHIDYDEGEGDGD